MQERKQYKISLPMTEKQKNKVEELLKFATFDGIPLRLEEIENSEEVQEEKEWPQDEDVYYFIDCDGDVIDSIFYAEDLFCKNILSIGNCFKTKEEAEFELERLKIIAEMKKFAEPEDRKWDGITEHWCVFYDSNNDSIQLLGKTEFKYDGIYFETGEKARECVKTVGEDRVKKYYLRVKE